MCRLWPLIPCACLLIVALGCPKENSNTKTGDGGPKEAAWFEDVTAKVNLDFTHVVAPECTGYYMPTLTGSGGAVFDFDADGRLDLYPIHNGGPNGPKNRLFHQEADGTFRDVSAGSGMDVAGWGQGAAVGDVNNDGKPDLLLTEFGAIRLFLNQGNGRFRDITKEAGLDNPAWGTSAAFTDYDRDGRLDFVIANYLDFDPTVKCGNAKPDFCGPNAYKGCVSRLFHNVGPAEKTPARFENVTVKAGLGSALGKGLGVIAADFNGDRLPDLFVANDQMANFLWINKGDGTFAEEALKRGLAFIGTGQPAANMGIAWADTDGNGLFDIFVTHINDEMHTLWRQDPRGIFQDRTVGAGLSRGWRSTGFGTAFVDFDRDGWPDVAWVNGGVYRNRGADASGPFWSAYAQRNQIFANDGKGAFRDLSEANPALCEKNVVARALIVADLDNDGAPDLITTEIAGPARVFRNVAASKGHWLAVRAVLPKAGGRDAIGAEIAITAGGKTFRRLLHPAYSYCCSNDPRAHFGFGATEKFDELRVIWPDGVEELFAGGTTDREIVVRQGEGKVIKN